MVVFIVLSLLGCANSNKHIVIDGSSTKTTEDSVNAIMSQLSDSKKMKFTIALTSIRFSSANSLLESINSGEMKALDYSILSEKLAGLNYTQIMKLAKKSEANIIYY